MGKRIMFYSSISDKQLFQITGFYSTDIQILEQLGHTVILSNSPRDFLYFWKYDIAFIYFWTRGLLPAIISKLFNKKVIFTGGIDVLDRNFNRSKKNFLLKKFLMCLCVTFSDVDIIVSQSDLQNIMDAKISIKKAKLIPHVINFDEYEFNFNQDVKENLITTVVWMETIGNVKRKGVDKMLYVLQEVFQSLDNFKVVVIGTMGEGTEYLKSIAQQLSISDKITFTGQISEQEKISQLKKSKFYFQLSEYEGFGVAAIEALAAGNIVIHSGKGGLAYSIGSFGVIEDNPNDYKAIARTVIDASCNYEDYRTFLEKGVQHVKDQYSFNVRKQAIKEVLTALKQ